MESLTNSKKIITILKKEAHIASHTALCELETEATYSSKNREEVLPVGFMRHPDLTPKLVWDNSERYYDSCGEESIVRSTVDASVVLETMIRTAKAAEESNAPYIESTYYLGIAKTAFQLKSSEEHVNPAVKKNFHHMGTFHIKFNY
ncbi:hypothetical protein QAD02_021629 [Eretmocerus hayati]|uniref:Uncharacterized protein n=1 Tax=Eretmocerus hayati TaxID=131215 RepID=A0ACC2PQQ7_9HYME|nr:hypothetical protein QAD02_021629 [Eretmocerus hayati]